MQYLKPCRLICSFHNESQVLKKLLNLDESKYHMLQIFVRIWLTDTN